SLHTPRPPRSTRFPYTTLFRSQHPWIAQDVCHHIEIGFIRSNCNLESCFKYGPSDEDYQEDPCIALCNEQNVAQIAIMARIVLQDRKSTRLNSSHVKISYAVFC